MENSIVYGFFGVNILLIILGLIAVRLCFSIMLSIVDLIIVIHDLRKEVEGYYDEIHSRFNNFNY